MQKCAEQNNKYKRRNLLLVEFHVLSNHQAESCLREVVSYKCFTLREQWGKLLTGPT